MNKMSLTNFGEIAFYIMNILISNWMLGLLLINYTHPWGLNDIYTVPIETVASFDNWIAFIIGIILCGKYLIHYYTRDKLKKEHLVAN